MISYWGVDHGEVSKALTPKQKQKMKQHAANGATFGLGGGLFAGGPKAIIPSMIAGGAVGAAYGHHKGKK